MVVFAIDIETKVWYNYMYDKDIANLKKIQAKLKNLKLPELADCYLNSEEQDLVRRIVKSVFGGIKSSEDRKLAISILSKTSWLDDM